MPQEPTDSISDWPCWPHAGSPIGCWPVRQQQGAFLGLFVLQATACRQCCAESAALESCEEFEPRALAAYTSGYLAMDGLWELMAMLEGMLSAEICVCVCRTPSISISLRQRHLHLHRHRHRPRPQISQWTLQQAQSAKPWRSAFCASAASDRGAPPPPKSSCAVMEWFLPLNAGWMMEGLLFFFAFGQNRRQVPLAG